MILHPPFYITSRLEAGLKVAGAEISLAIGSPDFENRDVYEVTITLADGTEHGVKDLRSGVGGGTVKNGFESLLTFLGAAAESMSYRGRYTGDPDDNSSLFSEPVSTWAAANSDEISMILCEVEESQGLIEE